jgi:hypothetical protein
VRNPLNGSMGHLRLASLDLHDREALQHHHEAAIRCTQARAAPSLLARAPLPASPRRAASPL